MLLETMRFLINSCFTDLMSTLKIHKNDPKMCILFYFHPRSLFSLVYNLERVRDMTLFDLLPFNH